jgi:hypothetical protein
VPEFITNRKRLTIEHVLKEHAERLVSCAVIEWGGRDRTHPVNDDLTESDISEPAVKGRQRVTFGAHKYTLKRNLE